MERIFRYICILAISLLTTLPCVAKKSKYRIEKEMPPAKFLNGFGVGIDGVGLGMKVTDARFANMEVMGRINFLEKYFPIVELGIGECTREGNELNTKFHTRSPYFRIGADYCFTKKRNGNRLLGGLRYGFSSFDYSYYNPEFSDEVYGTTPAPLNLKDLDGKAHWLELCVGVETRLWKIVRLGWTLRYKARLFTSFSEHGDPWFVPGFGKNGSTTWGGSVNLMFDL
ncbi:MAG: DUF6048 family protein [Bacteroidaceae bacterium]|nr:DUF6048 family protein [Bacteroidaceae bacterium]